MVYSGFVAFTPSPLPQGSPLPASPVLVQADLRTELNPLPLLLRREGELLHQNEKVPLFPDFAIAAPDNFSSSPACGGINSTSVFDAISHQS